MLSDNDSYLQDVYQRTIDELCNNVSQKNIQSDFAEGVCKRLFWSAVLSMFVAIGLFVIATKLSSGDVGFYLFITSLMFAGSVITCLVLSIIYSIKAGRLEAEADNLHNYMILLELDCDKL